MKLPQDAEIAPQKLTEYLLVKRAVGDKSEFLGLAGYVLDNWQQLEQDIRQQILAQEAVSAKQTIYGEYFEVRAPLTGPDGVTFASENCVDERIQDGYYQFITLYPDKGR